MVTTPMPVAENLKPPYAVVSKVFILQFMDIVPPILRNPILFMGLTVTCILGWLENQNF